MDWGLQKGLVQFLQVLFLGTGASPKIHVDKLVGGFAALELIWGCKLRLGLFTAFTLTVWQGSWDVLFPHPPSHTHTPLVYYKVLLHMASHSHPPQCCL